MQVVIVTKFTKKLYYNLIPFPSDIQSHTLHQVEIGDPASAMCHQR